VVIATPATTHFELAREALSRGKHVLCEKPLTMTVADAEELIQLAGEVDRTLFVGHTFLYNPAIRALHEIVQSEGLGSLLHYHAAWTAPGPVRHDVNAVWDLSPHPISILVHLFGRIPSYVTATGQAILEPDREDIAFLHLEFDDAATADIHVSWLARQKTRMFTLTGDKRVAIFDDMAPVEKLRVFETRAATEESDAASERIEMVPDRPIDVPEIAASEPLAAQLEHFLDCCRTGVTPRSGGFSAHCVVQVLEAADESLRSGGNAVAVKSRLAA
jgi:predicted dehydrogenase